MRRTHLRWARPTILKRGPSSTPAASISAWSCDDSSAWGRPRGLQGRVAAFLLGLDEVSRIRSRPSLSGLWMSRRDIYRRPDRIDVSAPPFVRSCEISTCTTGCAIIGSIIGPHSSQTVSSGSSAAPSAAASTPSPSTATLPEKTVFGPLNCGAALPSGYTATCPPANKIHCNPSCLPHDHRQQEARPSYRRAIAANVRGSCPGGRRRRPSTSSERPGTARAGKGRRRYRHASGTARPMSFTR